MTYVGCELIPDPSPPHHLVPNLTYTKAYREGPAWFSAERGNVVGALIPLLEGTEFWDRRWDIEWYVSKCITAGFCKTDDQVRLCAQRWMAGKRKVTPPGTKRRKTEAKKKAAMMSNVPAELTAAIEAVVAENAKAVAQFKGGTEKALNALVGGVMKRYKTDPATVKDLLIRRINE